ncbi:hypothetical protein AYI70_g8 [Smittium culicis]|uniref:Uncharacterized protein n=1 Tax=Smittium culicis TaxID=133412 RepID=A0A1R1YI37_9FUNG|nr:hypothetical protein AYI70_g8 [Smittium culicis]
MNQTESQIVLQNIKKFGKKENFMLISVRNELSMIQSLLELLNGLMSKLTKADLSVSSTSKHFSNILIYRKGLKSILKKSIEFLLNHKISIGNYQQTESFFKSLPNLPNYLATSLDENQLKKLIEYKSALDLKLSDKPEPFTPLIFRLDSIKNSELGKIHNYMEIEPDIIAILFIQYSATNISSPLCSQLSLLKMAFDLAIPSELKNNSFSEYFSGTLDPSSSDPSSDSYLFISDIVEFVVPQLNEKFPDMISLDNFSIENLFWSLFIYDSLIIYTHDSDILSLV